MANSQLSPFSFVIQVTKASLISTLERDINPSLRLMAWCIILGALKTLQPGAQTEIQLPSLWALEGIQNYLGMGTLFSTPLEGIYVPQTTGTITI